LDIIKEINNALNSFVWGYPMIILLLGTSIYLTVRMGFFQFRHFGYVLKCTLFSLFKKKSKDEISVKDRITPFQALTTALASTIGTGNIIGVSTAIIIGGPGAVFWMWLSACFGMITIFTENILSIHFRKYDKNGNLQGGTISYLERAFDKSNSLKSLGKTLAVSFSVFCAVAAFGTGNMVQINSIATAAHSEFSVPPIVSGIVIAILTGIIIIGGVNRIGKVTEMLVPVMSIFYIIFSVYVIAVNYKNIPNVLSSIISGAFGVDAITGGITGAVFKHAISLGFQRGVSSNEAGLGTAPMIHSASSTKDPVIQGMWGIFQVFVDTIVICTLTAFAILTSNVISPNEYGVYAGKNPINAFVLVRNAFSTALGDYACIILTISIILFAFSTLIGWCYNGEKAISYLISEKAIVPYRVIYVIFILVGSVTSLEFAWDVASTLNGLMAIPNLIGLLCLSGVAVKLKNKR